MDGKDMWNHVIIYDQRNDGRRYTFTAKGFADEQEATTYGEWQMARIGWGYSPSYKVFLVNNNDWVVIVRQYNSCD